eukprot:m.6819 g.6819  ORF g.6819 m.6819 type:complete len:249 (+) comp5569_c0_seq1:408-1154(+)
MWFRGSVTFDGLFAFQEELFSPAGDLKEDFVEMLVAAIRTLVSQSFDDVLVSVTEATLVEVTSTHVPGNTRREDGDTSLNVEFLVNAQRYDHFVENNEVYSDENALLQSQAMENIISSPVLLKNILEREKKISNVTFMDFDNLWISSIQGNVFISDGMVVTSTQSEETNTTLWVVVAVCGIVCVVLWVAIVFRRSRARVGTHELDSSIPLKTMPHNARITPSNIQQGRYETEDESATGRVITFVGTNK